MKTIRFTLTAPLTAKSIFTIYRGVDMHKRKPSPESHEFLELSYVSDCIGEHKFTIDGKTHSMKKGDVFIIPPNAVHQAAPYNKSVVDIISFEIDGDISKIYGKTIKLNAKEEQMFLSVINEGARLFVGTPEPGYEKGISLHQRTNELLLQKFKNQFELFLLELYLSETEPETLGTELNDEAEFDRIVSFMKNNVNKKLSLSEISLRFSLSTKKIQRLFEKFVSVSPMRYFTDLKLEAVKQLVLTTSKNSSEIARMLDFSSVNYLSRIFKERFGISPSQYAKTIKNSNKED